MKGLLILFFLSCQNKTDSPAASGSNTEVDDAKSDSQKDVTNIVTVKIPLNLRLQIPVVRSGGI